MRENLGCMRSILWDRKGFGYNIVANTRSG